MELTTTEFFVISIPVIIIMLYRRRREHPVRVFFLTLFMVYLYMVMHVTLFPIDLSEIRFNPLMARSINLDPFRYHLPRNIYLNVLLTIPFGFLYPFLWRDSWFKTIFLSLLSGLTIESLQLFIGSFTRNYSRVVDLADVLYNFLGVLVGYLIFRIIQWILRQLLRGHAYRRGSFAEYFFSMKGGRS